PNFQSSDAPEPIHHKLSRKLLAEICREMSVAPGRFSGTGAQEMAKKVRQQLIERIEDNLREYEFEPALTYAVSKLGALIHEDFVASVRLVRSMRHAVEFNRENQLA